MTSNYREIKNRYQNVVSGVSDYQMFQDIGSLIVYVESLHQVLLMQAAQRAAEEADRAFACCNERTAIPN